MKNSLFNGHPGLASNPNGGFDEFRQQVMLTMARKLAGGVGEFRIPACEIDDNSQYGLSMEVDSMSREFIFRVWKKQ